MKSLVFALITAFFWGLAPVFGKLGLESLSPFLALAVRSFIISAILLVFGLISGEFQNFSIDSKSLLFIAGEGIFASLLGHLSYFYALKYGDVSQVVPITSSFPLVAFLAALLFFHEKITLVKGLGALLIIVGIILVKR